MQENGEEGSFRSEQQIVLIQGPFILVGKVHVHACSVAQLCPTICDPVDCSRRAPLSMRFPRQEHWSGLPFPSPGDLSNPGMEPELAGGFFITEPPGKPPIAIRVYVLVPDNNHTHKIQKVGNGIIFLMM